MTDKGQLNKLCITATLALAVLFAALWIAIISLRVFQPFNYNRFLASIWISIAVSIATFALLQFSPWSTRALSIYRLLLARILAWASILLALDSFILEPFFVSRLSLSIGYDLRWQFQLLVAGMLGLTIVFLKRSWRWIPFSVISAGVGALWLLAILMPE